MDDSLAGKAALVTGGARRVGAAIARRLHAAGAAVLIHYRDSEADAARLASALNAARPKSAAKVKAELLAPVAPRALVSAALESFGRLDLVVNNASSFFPVAVGAMEPSHWEELIGSNLRAPLFIAQQAAAELAKNDGSIINIVDIHAERPLKGYALYSIAKAGLAAMTRSLALELAPRVRVNGVAPGAIVWPEDGQFPDWIEIQNPNVTPLNLAGYFLTDNPVQLNKWAFPAVTLPPNGFLVVFASGKNRTGDTNRLHTSFQLDAAGGFLALVKPNGTTIASAYTYPSVKEDVSFGIAQQQFATSLIANSVPQILVPTNASDLPANWNQLAYSPGSMIVRCWTSLMRTPRTATCSLGDSQAFASAIM